MPPVPAPGGGAEGGISSGVQSLIASGQHGGGGQASGDEEEKVTPIWIAALPKVAGVKPVDQVTGMPLEGMMAGFQVPNPGQTLGMAQPNIILGAHRAPDLNPAGKGVGAINSVLSGTGGDGGGADIDNSAGGDGGKGYESAAPAEAMINAANFLDENSTSKSAAVAA